MRVAGIINLPVVPRTVMSNLYWFVYLVSGPANERLPGPAGPAGLL